MATTTRQNIKPDLLADIKYPRNPVARIADLDERVTNLETFYGTLSKHGDLNNLGFDDHKQYAPSVSTSNRSATAADHITNTTGNSFTIGVGVPTRPNGVNPKLHDAWLRLDTPTIANQRLYICTVGGASPTWVGVL